ncbi:hypothetical protein BC834DRAFT_845794 [Gloeopeniophorella convolvens]|nr:hypothetical protein BC834DRAFT_845794 [Gloeopeniophorella convolvens]
MEYGSGVLITVAIQKPHASAQSRRDHAPVYLSFPLGLAVASSSAGASSSSSKSSAAGPSRLATRGYVSSREPVHATATQPKPRRLPTPPRPSSEPSGSSAVPLVGPSGHSNQPSGPRIPPPHSSPSSPPQSPSTIQRSYSEPSISPITQPRTRQKSLCGYRPLPQTPNSAPAAVPARREPSRSPIDRASSEDTASTISDSEVQSEADADAPKPGTCPFSWQRWRPGDLSSQINPDEPRHQPIPTPISARNEDVDRPGANSRTQRDKPLAPQLHTAKASTGTRPWLSRSPKSNFTFARRQSRRWLREEGGKRWVEEDYEVILRSLRTLR